MASTTSSEFVSWFANLRVSDLIAAVETVPLVSVKPDTKISEAFAIICQAHVHCVPVLSASEEAGGKEVCVGLLDLRDYVAYLVEAVSDTSSELKPDSALSLMNYSKANDLQPVRINERLTEALKLFARHKKLHRVPIITEDCPLAQLQVLHMLSHSTILQFFHGQREGPLQSFFATKLSAFPELAVKEVLHTAATTDTLLEAMTKFLHKGVNALPIVADSPTDEGRKLLGSISVSDVQYGVLSNLDNLQQPLSSFLVEASRNTDHLYADETRIRLSNSPVTAVIDDTIGSVIAKIVDHKISHVWTVDDNFQPVGVLTCFDIIEALAAYAFSVIAPSLGEI